MEKNSSQRMTENTSYNNYVKSFNLVGISYSAIEVILLFLFLFTHCSVLLLSVLVVMFFVLVLQLFVLFWTSSVQVLLHSVHLLLYVLVLLLIVLVLLMSSVQVLLLSGLLPSVLLLLSATVCYFAALCSCSVSQ